MRPILFAIILNATLASAAVSEPFYVGTWAADGISCDAQNTDAVPIRFSETTFFGYESQCKLTNPVNIRDMDGILFDLECWGEGMQYFERILLLKEADGRLTQHSRGYTSSYNRCY